MWVAARQYTGRIVTITNDNIFKKPVYNYTREFPFIWEKMRLSIPYNADRRIAEQIIPMPRAATRLESRILAKRLSRN